MLTAPTSTTAATQQPHSRKARPARRVREDLREHLAEDIARRMAFKDAQLTDSPKRQISLFSRGINDLVDVSAAFRRLVDDAVKTNIFVETDRENRDREEDLRAQAYDAIKGHIPAWKFSIPDVLDWKLGDLCHRELYDFLGTFLWEQTRMLCAGFADHLQEMVDCNLFGLHKWHPTAPGWGRYHFFRVRRLRCQTQVKQSRARQKIEDRDRNHFEVVETIETVRTSEQTLVLERHEHQIYDADLYPYPASEVLQPSWVRSFMGHVPEVCRAHIGVVAGGMLREEIKSHVADHKIFDEREVTRKIIRQKRLISPAVVIGNVVLTGWSKTDTDAERGPVGRLLGRCLSSHRIG